MYVIKVFRDDEEVGSFEMESDQVIDLMASVLSPIEEEEATPRVTKKKKNKKVTVEESPDGRKRLSEEDVTRIEDMLKDGQKPGAIAKEIGCSAPVVYMIKQRLKNSGDLPETE